MCFGGDLIAVAGLHVTARDACKPVDGKGEIIGALTVQDDDSIMCITSQGTSLRVEASQISQQGRGSSGVRVVDITEPDYVVGIDRIARSEDDKLDS